MPKSKAVVKKEVKEQEIEILTAEEVKKLDKAVEFINKQANNTAKSLLETGKYLLNEFFDGDVKKAEDRAPRKGISLRKIAEHKDITQSYMTLSNAIKLAAQESMFADPKFKTLSESHKLLLFRLPDDKTKKTYASKVVSDNLSVRGLQDILVNKGLIEQRGRPALEEGKKKPKSSRNPFDSFFNPLEKLAEFSLDIDSIEPDYLTQDKIDVLTELRSKIDRLLEKVKK
jgi:hypothetical protein